MSDVRRALVTGVGRNAAWIAYDGEPGLRLAALPKRRGQSMLLPGDVVMARPLDDEREYIEVVEPREFTLVRTTGAEREKAMAANVDTVVIVAALDNPPLRLGLIDRIVAFAQRQSIRALLVLTKIDLADPARAADIARLYEPLAVATLATRPKFGVGIEAVRAALAQRRALLVGQSGVGKSSLYGALGGEAAVGAVNAKTGKGRQTTTSARLYRTPGGFLIDSPGVREFALGAVEPAELAWCFVEMREPAGQCRFSDCTHRHEPGCAVLAAVAAGRIAASRYESYRRILDQVPD